MTEKIKNSIQDFVGALQEFLDWCDTDDEPKKEIVGFNRPEPEEIPELSDMDEIRAALENGKEFSVPFITAEICRLSFLNAAPFHYNGCDIYPAIADDEMPGFDVYSSPNLCSFFPFAKNGENAVDLIADGVDWGYVASSVGQRIDDGFEEIRAQMEE